MDAAELIDARLSIRGEKERSATSRIKAAYGEKFDPMLMYASKRDVATLLHEEAETRSVRERLRRKQQQQTQQKQNKQKQRDVGFNTVVNSSFLVLIPAALIGMAVAVDLEAFAQSFLFFLIFAPACATMLNKLMYMTNYKMQAEESMRRIDEILLTREQTDPREPDLPQSNEVKFDHVTFTYPTGEGPAISDVSFCAKSGTVTALVGHSGSGKSTIGALIPRFYDIQKGSISIGGVELSSMNRKELMERVAFVFQNPKLLKTTIEDNVRGGKKNATSEEILRALHLAGCDDILQKFPDGIHTVIGGKGIYLPAVKYKDLQLREQS